MFWLIKSSLKPTSLVTSLSHFCITLYKTQQNKTNKPSREIYVYLCCLHFLSSIHSTHSDQTFSSTALLKLPLSWYYCSPCHVQRSFLSFIFLLAASGAVDLPSSLKQSPLDSGFLLTISLSLAKFSSYFLQVCPMAFP